MAGSLRRKEGTIFREKLPVHSNAYRTGPDDASLKRLQAEVVSQLRYEYALNLIQKLGMSLTPGGPGFLPLEWDQKRDGIPTGQILGDRPFSVGVGACHLGYAKAGFKVVAAIDNDDLSMSTYGLNHKRTHLVKDDIRLTDPRMLLEKLDLAPGDLDLMAGCPPCQGFSTLRTLNGGRDINEPLNDLVYDVRAIR